MPDYGAWTAGAQGLGGFAQALLKKREMDAAREMEQQKLNADMALKSSQIAKLQGKGGEGGGVDPEQAFKYESQLRDDLTKASKDFATQTAALGRIEQSAKSPSAAGDLALIFNYMKMLDPGSTVREGEFANAQNAAGVTDQVRNAYNRAISGERLNPSQRQDFYKSARRTYKGALDTQVKIRKDYEKLASQYGVSPKNVLLGFGAEPSWYEGGFNPEDASGLGVPSEMPAPAAAGQPAQEMQPNWAAQRLAARRKALEAQRAVVPDLKR